MNGWWIQILPEGNNAAWPEMVLEAVRFWGVSDTKAGQKSRIGNFNRCWEKDSAPRPSFQFHAGNVLD
jgi:hypothetical protein